MRFLAYHDQSTKRTSKCIGECSAILSIVSLILINTTDSEKILQNLDYITWGAIKRFLKALHLQGNAEPGNEK